MLEKQGILFIRYPTINLKKASLSKKFNAIVHEEVTH